NPSTRFIVPAQKALSCCRTETGPTPSETARLEVLPGGVSGPPAEGFEIAYADRCGSEFRLPLSDAQAVRFEDVVPVRAF
ncbi:hypothetical protein ABZ109_07440, partial [Streptomyces sp. NPDC006274]